MSILHQVTGVTFVDEVENTTSASTLNNVGVRAAWHQPYRLHSANPNIVFIDPTVEDYQSLMDGVIPGTEVILLDAAKDGVEQITQHLINRSNLHSVHIVSHGSPGCLYLGNSQLSLDTLESYKSQLQTGFSNLTNLLLYGCNVAAGDAGTEFIEKLHQLTGAKIAASANRTGNAAFGGDWKLEVTTDNIDISEVFQAEVKNNYTSVLTTDLILDFDGGTLKSGKDYRLLRGAAGVKLSDFKPFDKSDGTPGNRNEQIWQILAGVREDYADFDVRVIWDDRGVKSPFFDDNQDTVVMIVDNNGKDIGIENYFGIAPSVDVGNSATKDTAFVFQPRFQGFGEGNVWSQVRALITTASHEAGHNFGLPHVKELDSDELPRLQQGRQIMIGGLSKEVRESRFNRDLNFDSRFSFEILDLDPRIDVEPDSPIGLLNKNLGTALIVPEDKQFGKDLPHSGQALPEDPYVPFLDQNPSTPSEDAIGFGEFVSQFGSIDFLGDRDAFRFKAEASGQYTIFQRSFNTSLNPVVTLWDGEGAFVKVGTGEISTITFNAKAGQTYFAIAGSEADRQLSGAVPTVQTGIYALSVAGVLNIITVDNLEDEIDGDLSTGDVSLREAILVANAGGTIDFASTLAGKTIDLTLGELVIDKDLTINGLGVDQLSVSGNNASRIFKVDDGDNDNLIDVEIEGLTITDANAGGGGGISNKENLTVNSVTLSGNEALFGGAIENRFGSTLILNDSTIENNQASSSGGGIENSGDLTVNNSTISSNQASLSGGGIDNSLDSNVTINNSTISSNQANFGGGIDNFGNITVNDSTISNNQAGNSGGGIANEGNVIVTSSTISDNSAGVDGGGIDNTFNDTLTVTNSTISGNKANRFGGGIENDGTLTVNNSTITDNTADNDNDGSGAGGGIATSPDPSGPVEIQNTIVAGNFDTPNNAGPGSFKPDVSGEFMTARYNLIGDGTGSTGLTFDDNNIVGSNDEPIDPKLGSLQDNGGSTETHALLSGSPAIDNGDPNFTSPPEFDQRGSGFPRILDSDGEGTTAIDIGAFESKFVSLPSDIFGTDGDDGTGLLRGTDNDERIFGLAGDDRMRGRDGDDILFGGPGNEKRMRGDNGDDTLIGGLGDDVLFGNDGSDTFVLAAGEGTDTIRDFELDENDKIGLAGGLQYSQLTFNDDKILFGNEVLAEVSGIDTASLTSSNFVTI